MHYPRTFSYVTRTQKLPHTHQLLIHWYFVHCFRCLECFLFKCRIFSLLTTIISINKYWLNFWKYCDFFSYEIIQFCSEREISQAANLKTKHFFFLLVRSRRWYCKLNEQIENFYLRFGTLFLSTISSVNDQKLILNCYFSLHKTSLISVIQQI